MDNLAGISEFVLCAETCSFVEAGRLLGVSASAIGKQIGRVEARLGVRLFHRNTRSMKLTAEGALFLQRCQRILGELSAAEEELSHIRAAPRGRLRVSVPSVGTLLHPAIAKFVHQYPDIELDMDFSDRKVDVIEEGFDAVIRIGKSDDSRLMSRQLGVFHRYLVASPDYLKQASKLKTPADLRDHTCLFYKLPTTGKIDPWPIVDWEKISATLNRSPMSCNAIETLHYMAVAGRGIACLPDFEVRDALASRQLRRVFAGDAQLSVALAILWPTGKFMAPKLRAFIDLFSNGLTIKRT